MQAHIVSVDAKKRRLELSLVGPAPPPTPGQLVLGRVLATGGAGVNVQIGGRAAGKVRQHSAACLTPALPCQHCFSPADNTLKLVEHCPQPEPRSSELNLAWLSHLALRRWR